MIDKKLESALNFLDPSTLCHEDWCNVGMALHAEGEPFEIWDSWSATDHRAGQYNRRQNEAKWKTFKANGGITAGTIIQMAKDRGWSWEGEELSWCSVIGAHENDALTNFDPTRDPEDWVSQFLPDVWDPVAQLRQYLTALFRSDEHVNYVTTYYLHGDRKDPTSGVSDRTMGQLMDALAKHPDDITATIGDYDHEWGAYIRINPVDGNGVSDDNVTDYRYGLIEADDGTLEEQYHKIDDIGLPVAALVYSGGKSLHAICRIDAISEEEFKARMLEIFELFKRPDGTYSVDKANKNPARLSRMPGIERNGKKQFIIPYKPKTKTWLQWHDLQMVKKKERDIPDIVPMAAHVGKNLKPVRPELISGILRQGHKMLLSGSSKAGKSFALIELAMAIANGWEWFGWQCMKGKVLYCNFEIDPESFYNRFETIAGAINVDPEEATENVLAWNLRGLKLSADEFSAQLRSKIQKEECAAVIIDPIYKLGLGDENSAGDVGAFCSSIDTICQSLGCSVIYAHHHSKGSQSGKAVADRASGSGVFARDADAIVDMIQLRIPKSMASFMDQNPLATAWRVSCVLREFATPLDKDLWFDYPLHVIDEDGALRSARASDESWDVDEMAEAHTAKASARAGKAISAFNILVERSPGGKVKIGEIIKLAYAEDKKPPQPSTVARYFYDTELYNISNGVTAAKNDTEVWEK